METVREEKSMVARTLLWCAVPTLPCLVFGAVFSNLQDNKPFSLLYWVGAIGTFALSIVSIVAGLSAHWDNHTRLWGAADKAAAGRMIEFGVIGLILIPIFAIMVPIREYPRISANEASAIGSLRTLHTAARAYAEAYPEHGFPASL